MNGGQRILQFNFQPARLPFFPFFKERAMFKTIIFTAAMIACFNAQADSVTLQLAHKGLVFHGESAILNTGGPQHHKTAKLISSPNWRKYPFI